jgi:hypothetical protein
MVDHPAQRASDFAGGSLHEKPQAREERTSFLKKRSKKLLLIGGLFTFGAATPSK